MLTLKKKYLSLSAILLITLISCSTLPTSPEIWQCQFNGDPRAFTCYNNKTFEERTFPGGHPDMKAAQCLSADDYLKFQDYISALKDAIYKEPNP